MAHAHGSAAAKSRGRLVAVFVLTLVILVVEVIGGDRLQQPRAPRRRRAHAHRRGGCRDGAPRDLVRGTPRDERAHVRLPARRDHRRGDERVPAVRGRGIHPLRGVAPVVRAARHRVRADARDRARRPRRQCRLDVPAARRPAREPEHAWGLPRGDGRLPRVGRRHPRRDRDRADRLGPGRRRRLGGHRAAHPAAHVLPPARRDRRAPRGDPQGRRHGPCPGRTSSTRPASSTATTSTPGRSRRA